MLDVSERMARNRYSQIEVGKMADQAGRTFDDVDRSEKHDKHPLEDVRLESGRNVRSEAGWVGSN